MSNHIKLLADKLPPETRPEFRAYVNELLDIDQWYGIDPTFLGFMEDYQTLAEIIGRHITESDFDGIIQGKNFVIYDIGCAAALQHVFFGKCIGYVGVSPLKNFGNGPDVPEPRFFLPNCKFFNGYLSEVVDAMEIDYERSFGIANMSILYDSSQITDLEIFNRVFKRKFII